MAKRGRPRKIEPVKLGRTEKTEVQKQKSPKQLFDERLVGLSDRVKILEMMSAGYSDKDICETLGISQATLMSRKDEINQSLTQTYIETLDLFRARQLARYEEMYLFARAHAFGEVIPNKDVKTIAPGIANKDWFKLALDVMKAETELLKADLEQAAKRRADEEDLNNSDIHTQTITLATPLAQVAGEYLRKEWTENRVLDYIYEESAKQEKEESDDPLDMDMSSIERQLREMQARIHDVEDK